MQAMNPQSNTVIIKYGGIGLLALLLGAFLPVQARAAEDYEGVKIRTRKDAKNIRVLTANIRFPLERDAGTGDEWHLRKDLTVEVMTAQDADIIGTQETRREQQEVLQKALPGYECFDLGEPEYIGGPTNPSNLVFWRTARFEAKSAGGYWYSLTPNKPLTKFAQAANTRYMTWILLRDKLTGHELLMFNTHLDYRMSVGMLMQAKTLVAFTSGTPPKNAARILTGDFNTGADSDGIKHIKGAGWIDSYVTIHGKKTPGPTMHGFNGINDPASKRRRKIDFIFHNEWFRAVDAEIIRDHRGRRYPSDHFWVSAELEYVK